MTSLQISSLFSAESLESLQPPRYEVLVCPWSMVSLGLLVVLINFISCIVLLLWICLKTDCQIMGSIIIMSTFKLIEDWTKFMEVFHGHFKLYLMDLSVFL